MKNLIKYIFSAIIFLFGFSCDKNEIVETDDTCGENAAKFIKNWCVDDLAAIEILSNNSMGEEWTRYGKTFRHAVLAVLDSTLSKANEDWSSVIGSSDSVFYFNYVSDQIENDCKLCCPPAQTIIITSLASRPCPTTNN